MKLKITMENVCINYRTEHRKTCRIIPIIFTMSSQIFTDLKRDFPYLTEVEDRLHSSAPREISLCSKNLSEHSETWRVDAKTEYVDTLFCIHYDGKTKLGNFIEISS